MDLQLGRTEYTRTTKQGEVDNAPAIVDMGNDIRPGVPIRRYLLLSSTVGSPGITHMHGTA